jgi:hypothetical protein
MQMSGQLHASTALLRWKSPWYPGGRLDVVAKKKVSFPIPAGNQTPAVQLRNLANLLLQLPETLSD